MYQEMFSLVRCACNGAIAAPLMEERKTRCVCFTSRRASLLLNDQPLIDNMSAHRNAGKIDTLRDPGFYSIDEKAFIIFDKAEQVGKIAHKTALQVVQVKVGVG